MPVCTNPRLAWFAPGLNPNGLEYLVFRRSQADTSRPVSVDCGKCFPCVQAKGMEMGIRLVNDWSVHGEGCFITLTYNPASCPERLVRSDLEAFCKRLDYHLRKRGKRFRGLAVGEYGSRFARPHYHLALIGHDYCAQSERSGFADTADDQYLSSFLSDVWGRKGVVDLRPMVPGRIFYTANHYIKNFECADSNGCRIVSRRPMLGGGWLSRYFLDLRKGFITIEGVKYRIPRSYLARSEYREPLAAMRQARREFAENRVELPVGDAELAERGSLLNAIARSKLSKGKL